MGRAAIMAEMTNEELRRKIGALLGYAVGDFVFLGMRAGYRLTLNGERMGEYETYDKAWSHVPNWPEDVAAALGLITQTDVDFSMNRGAIDNTGMRWEWLAFVNSYPSYANEPARAICLAWLAWKEAQHGD